MEDERPFVIPVRRGWTLLILPFLALVYFLVVVWLAATRTRIQGVPMEWLVLGGLGFFLLVALIQLPFLFRRRARRAEPEPVPERAWQDEPPEPASSMPVTRDDERVTTDETQQGLRVLEYSRPAKSRHRGAVYAKTYVPVTKEHVLRIETLAAEPHEL